MSDKELSFRVRYKEPRSLDEAYRFALQTESLQKILDSGGRQRNVPGVQVTHEVDLQNQIQQQLNSFLAAQQETQRRWQQMIEEKLDARLEQTVRLNVPKQ